MISFLAAFIAAFVGAVLGYLVGAYVERQPWWIGYRPNGTPYRTKGLWGIYASHIGGYMHRWILSTPFGTLRVHHILRADTDADPHDHPFDFLSFIVRGGYGEVVVDAGRYVWDTHWWPRWSVIRHKAEDTHRIHEILPNTWTLVISGSKRRAWGFLTAAGWVPWRNYVGVE